MLTNNSRVVCGIAVVLVVGAVAGCAHGDGAIAPVSGVSAGSSSAGPDLFVVDTGVETAPRLHSEADWSFNTDDPAALAGFSTAVVSGKVVAVERSYVDDNGLVVTAYSVRVEKVYKGEDIPDVISVTLPGGSVALGEYIAALDTLGLYEMKLGSKDPELLRTAGVEAVPDQDPRSMDPSTLVTENWGVNPASESTVAEIRPESWVFYLVTDDDVYYGAGFDHALSYLKDGRVHALNTESERSPVSEDELFGR